MESFQNFIIIFSLFCIPLFQYINIYNIFIIQIYNKISCLVTIVNGGREHNQNNSRFCLPKDVFRVLENHRVNRHFKIMSAVVGCCIFQYLVIKVMSGLYAKSTSVIQNIIKEVVSRL